jgi:hypothetical protein
MASFGVGITVRDQSLGSAMLCVVRTRHWLQISLLWVEIIKELVYWLATCFRRRLGSREMHCFGLSSEGLQLHFFIGTLSALPVVGW